MQGSISRIIKKEKPLWFTKNNMTVEEKAKAYDEALKQAKFYHGNCPSEPERKKLEKMFPVLHESEDEKTINDACCWLGEYAGYIGSKNYGKSSMLFCLVDKLKSLRPHWKPSEEQIKAIRLAKSFVVDDFDEHPTLSEILMELEEQLKKLM